jgi:hypothetical protein
MSIKISELLAFIESVRTRETEKKKKVTLSPLQLPENLEIDSLEGTVKPVLERSEVKPKRKRTQKKKEPESLLSVDPA